MSVVYSHALKYSQGDFARNQEMDHSNNIGDPQQHCHQQHNSGVLMRHRSAPNPMLTNHVADTTPTTINHHDDHQHHYLPTTSSEMEVMLTKLISPNTSNMANNLESLYKYEGGSGAVKKEEEDKCYNFGYNNNEAQVIYQHHHYDEQIQGLQNGSMNGFDGAFNEVNSMALENNTQAKMGSVNCSNLIRQKSSPAGFFSNYSVDNGYRGCDISNGQAATSSTSSGIHATRPSFCNMPMPQIVESGSEGLEPICVENRRNLIGNDNDDNGSNTSYMQSFTSDHFWDGSAFNNGSKTATGNREITFFTPKMEAQGADFGYQKLGLTHHLSLPSSSTKIGGMNKLFQIQGSVPCKIRAKRGFATHPRSIAERERRTRISERIKKLQDLFPKSDKQTSTSDMLDFAVQYIKDLQKHVKILKDSRAKCTCSSNQNQ